MKAMNLILPLAVLTFLLLAGCGRQINPASEMSQQIQQWAPGGTPVAAAQKAMEQHQFVCTVNSYNSKAAMPQDSDPLLWVNGTVINGRVEATTSVTILDCQRTDPGMRYEARLTAINGQLSGVYFVSALRSDPSTTNFTNPVGKTFTITNDFKVYPGSPR